MRKEKAMAVMRCAGMAIAGMLAGCGWYMMAGVENVLAAESTGEEMAVSDVAADASGELSENSWGGKEVKAEVQQEMKIWVYMTLRTIRRPEP